MKKLRSQLLRWTLIVRKIQSRPYLSFRELQREIERELYFRGCEPACSEATLKRDLSELREDFGIEIAYDRARNGYKIQYIEKEWLDVDNLMEPLEILTALGAEDGLPDYILPEKYPVKGAQHLSGMIYAIRHARQIGFRYRKYSDGSSSGRILSPYALKEWRGRWYVIGKEREEDEEFKTFGLDRIEELNIMQETFRKDESFDPVRKFEYSYGIYSSPEYPVEELVLRFDAEDGRYLASHPLHASQQTEETEDGKIIVRARLRITPDLMMELLSRSWSVEVLQPDILRRQLCAVYEEALKRNSH